MHQRLLQQLLLSWATVAAYHQDHRHYNCTKMRILNLRAWFSKGKRSLNANTTQYDIIELRAEDSLLSRNRKWTFKKLLFVTFVCVFLWIYLPDAIFTESTNKADSVSTSTIKVDSINISTIKGDSVNLSRKVKLKYILQWTSKDTAPLSFWRTGQRVFIEHKCPVTNCYVTDRRDFFGGDVTKFDAIVFNGRNLKNYHASYLPKKRSPHQIYLFLNMESSDNEPICNPIFDGFFNWTATYKLNSDIVYSYILIRNMAGEEVGPKINMTWIDPLSDINETFARTLENKTKAVAWFVSHCKTRSDRENYANSLKIALNKFKLTLDIYGKCGHMDCPRFEKEYKCDDILRNTYYFYLSLENSFMEDYITEKALTALLNDVAPIVYGGANYSRYLPHGSYLDARKYKPKDLASLIAHLMKSPAEYYTFFRWQNHYSYEKPDNVCRVCAALNDQSKLSTRHVYKDFRGWWNPDHVKRCKDDKWGA